MRRTEIDAWCERRRARAPRATGLEPSLPSGGSTALTALHTLQSLARSSRPRVPTTAVAAEPASTGLAPSLTDAGRTAATVPAEAAPLPMCEGFEVLHTECGGMGSLYVCYDEEYGFPFVVKTFRQDLFLDRAEILPRFLDEIAVWTSLGQHPNIVRAYGARKIGDLPYLFLELIPGLTVSELLEEEGPLAPADVVEAGLQICNALLHADKRAPGFVHGDLKPSNLLVLDGRVKVTDFGLARTAASPDSRGGTPTYMAPEQWEQGELDARTDTYSLGLVLYAMLAGAPPFHGSAGELRELHLSTRPPPLQKPTREHAELASLIMRCLRKDPRTRPGTRELRRSLRELEQPGQARVFHPTGLVDAVRGNLLYTFSEYRKRNRIERVLAFGDELGGLEAALRDQLAALLRGPCDAAALDRLCALGRLRESCPEAFAGWDARTWEVDPALLRGNDMPGLFLPGASLAGADLSGACLQDAWLAGAVLEGADLSGARLPGAVLRGADLRGATLAGADLRGADLAGARLEGAQLAEAGLDDAALAWVNVDAATTLPADFDRARLLLRVPGLDLELVQVCPSSLVRTVPPVCVAIRRGLSTERFRAAFDETAPRHAELIAARVAKRLGECAHSEELRRMCVAELLHVESLPYQEGIAVLVAFQGRLVYALSGGKQLVRSLAGEDREVSPANVDRHRLQPVGSGVLLPREGELFRFEERGGQGSTVLRVRATSWQTAYPLPEPCLALWGREEGWELLGRSQRWLFADGGTRPLPGPAHDARRLLAVGPRGALVEGRDGPWLLGEVRRPLALRDRIRAAFFSDRGRWLFVRQKAGWTRIAVAEGGQRKLEQRVLAWHEGRELYLDLDLGYLHVQNDALTFRYPVGSFLLPSVAGFCGQRLVVAGEGREPGTGAVVGAYRLRERTVRTLWVARLPSKRRAPRFLTFSPDGQRVAAFGPESELCVWRLDTGSLELRADVVTSAVAFSADGAALGWVAAEGGLRVLRLAEMGAQSA